MADLLLALYNLFKMNLVDAPIPRLKTVHIWDTFAMETLLKIQHLPTLVITPTKDWHVQGPFAETARESYAIRLRIVANSIDVHAYVTGNMVANVHQLSSDIRDILYQNKKLTNTVFELNPKFEAVDINVLYQSKLDGHFSARDIFIEYTKLELYTGMQNEQNSLELPPYVF